MEIWSFSAMSKASEDPDQARGDGVRHREVLHLPEPRHRDDEGDQEEDHVIHQGFLAADRDII